MPEHGSQPITGWSALGGSECSRSQWVQYNQRAHPRDKQQRGCIRIPLYPYQVPRHRSRAPVTLAYIKLLYWSAIRWKIVRALSSNDASAVIF